MIERQKPALIQSDGILGRDLSRRKALFLGLSLVTLPAFLKTSQDLDFENIDNLENELKKHPNTRIYYHNAANNLDTLKEALEGPAANVEIDVIHVDDGLFVSHNLEDFMGLSDSKKQEYKLEKIVNQVIAADKNPAFDLKISDDNIFGFDLFTQEVKALVPQDRLITFSGGTFDFLDQIESSDKRIVAYTLNNQNVDEYYKKANTWIEQGIIGRGATVQNGSDTMKEVIDFNTGLGVNLQTNVWPVNSINQAYQLLLNGVNGITTDSELLILRADKVLSNNI